MRQPWKETPLAPWYTQLPWSEFSSLMKKAGWFVTVRKTFLTPSQGTTVSFPPQKNSIGV